jgi:SagB-type dehydrogenase family enzyme
MISPAADRPAIPGAHLRNFCYPPELDRNGDRGGALPDPAEDYHEASKIHRDFPGRIFGPARRFFETTPAAATSLGRKSLGHAGEVTSLSRPDVLRSDLVALSTTRRSGMPVDTGGIDLAELGALLALSAGSTPDEPELRSCPSAGAMYPVDLIVAASDVTGLAPGSFVYDPIEHVLVRRAVGDAGQLHGCAAIGEPIPTGAVTFAFVCTFARTRAKYGLRGYRFALLEAGHLAQAAITVATALGLATLPWGGYLDQSVDEFLELDGTDRSCVYLLTIGGHDWTRRPDPEGTDETGPDT